MGPYVSVRLLLLRLQRKHCIYVYAAYVCLHACVGADKAIDIKPLLAEVEQRARAYVRTFKWALMYAYLYAYVCVFVRLVEMPALSFGCSDRKGAVRGRNVGVQSIREGGSPGRSALLFKSPSYLLQLTAAQLSAGTIATVVFCDAAEAQAAITKGAKWPPSPRRKQCWRVRRVGRILLRRMSFGFAGRNISAYCDFKFMNEPTVMHLSGTPLVRPESSY